MSETWSAGLPADERQAYLGAYYRYCEGIQRLHRQDSAAMPEHTVLGSMLCTVAGCGGRCPPGLPVLARNTAYQMCPRCVFQRSGDKTVQAELDRISQYSEEDARRAMDRLYAAIDAMKSRLQR